MDVFDLMEAKSTELKCGICGTPIELLLADGKTGSADERKTRLKVWECSLWHVRMMSDPFR